MRKQLLGFISTCLIIGSVSTVFAESTHHLTLINHYTQSLTVTVGINPDVLPDYQAPFILPVNGSATSVVLDLGKEAYLRGEGEAKKHGFFGVEIENGKTLIRGYMSKGIAFSWKDEVLTFCTPEDYKPKQSC